MNKTESQQNHVVSFSGGRTSAYLVYEMEKRRKEEQWKVDYVFMDTGAEHPKTYEFIRNVVKHFDINLTCLRLKVNPQLGKGNTYNVVDLDSIGNDLVPFGEMVKKYGTPSIIAPWCTGRMKIDIYNAYFNKKYGKNNYVTWLGIRIDEKRRIRNNPYVRYLAEISQYKKEDIISWWLKMPFDLEIEEHLGNCVFCIKKGAGKLALAARDSPELYENFLTMLKNPDNRKSPRHGDDLIMYRNYKTLEQIVEDFSEFSYQDICETLRFTKKYDTGSCSESCEVFSDEKEPMTN